MYGMISPSQVSYRPIDRRMSNNGPTSDTAGNMAMARASDRMSFLPGNSRRAMA